MFDFLVPGLAKLRAENRTLTSEVEQLRVQNLQFARERDSLARSLKDANDQIGILADALRTLGDLDHKSGTGRIVERVVNNALAEAKLG